MENIKETIGLKIIGSFLLGVDDCTIQNIDIPNNVEYIAINAFDKCFNLTSLTIPNSVKYIAEYAFDACNDLTDIAITNSIKVIEDRVFCCCFNLTNVFYYGTPDELKEINVSPDNDELFEATVHCI